MDSFGRHNGVHESITVVNFDRLCCWKWLHHCLLIVTVIHVLVFVGGNTDIDNNLTVISMMPVLERGSVTGVLSYRNSTVQQKD